MGWIWIKQKNPSCGELLINYSCGDYYFAVSDEIQIEVEAVCGSKVEERLFSTTTTDMLLSIYENSDEGMFYVTINSEHHLLHLNTGAKTRSDIEAIVALFSKP